MNLDFLSSRRFWALVGIAVLGVLKTENIVSADIVNALVVILGGCIGIRTHDRTAELLAGK